MEHTYTNQNEFFMEAFQKRGLTIVGAKNKIEQIFWMLRSSKDIATFDTRISILSQDTSAREMAEILFSTVPNVSQNDPFLNNITLHTGIFSDEDRLEKTIRYETFQNNTKVFFLEGFEQELTDSPSTHENCERFLHFCERLTRKYDIHIILLKRLLSTSSEEQSPSLYDFRMTPYLLHRLHHIIRLEGKAKDVLQTYSLKPNVDSIFEEPFPV